MQQRKLLETARLMLTFIAESVARFEQLLDANEFGLAENEQRIFVSLVNRAHNLRDDLLFDVQTLLDAAERKSTLGIARTTSKASVHFTSLEELHRDLRHLPIPDVRRESITFLRLLIKRLSPLFVGRDPIASLHLSHDLVHGQHDVSQGPAVIDLPKLDYSNPLSWPVLAHEVAHGILPAVSYGPTLSPVVRSWLIEIGCDRVALYVCGPAYFAAFGLRTVVDSTYPTGTNRHPSGRRRLAAILTSPPRGLARTQLFQTISDLVRARSVAYDQAAVRGLASGDQLMRCQSCNKPYTTQETTDAEAEFDSNIAGYLVALDRRLRDVGLQPQRYNVSPDVVDDLRAHRLIGASHDRDRALQEFGRLERLRARETTSRPAQPQRLIDQLTQTLGALKDEPNDILDIVTNGWAAYFQESAELFENYLTLAAHGSTDGWDKYKNAVIKYDELLLASIETANFQQLLQER